MSKVPHILVIEPNDINRNLLREILREHACRITEAVDCRRGLNAAIRHVFDAVLLDKHACLTNGSPTGNKILALCAAMPVIIFCNHLSPHELRVFMMGGIFGFIFKPYTTSQLLSKLDEAVAYRRTRAQAGSGTPVSLKQHL